MFVVVAGGGGSNCNYNKVKEEIETETLDFITMGKEEGEDNNNSSNNNNNILKVEDVEEGEISDSASVEEISEEDFKKQEVVVVDDDDDKPSSITSNKESTVTSSTKPKEDQKQGNANGNGRVWTMSDLYRFQMKGGYVNGLYSLAWAQAVQSKPGKSSKPLNELVNDVVGELDENSKRSSPSSSAASVNSNNSNNTNNVDDEKKKVDFEKVVIDDSGDEMDIEKEDGELEEGEIDLDMEPAHKIDNGFVLSSAELMNVDGLEVESKEKSLEKKLSAIREALENVTLFEVNKSFDAVCSKLCETLEILREFVQENGLSIKDDLIQLSISAIRVVCSVFPSMSYKLREQYKDCFSRLLSLVNSCVPSLFNTEHAKEIEVILAARDISGVFLSSISRVLNKKDNDVFGKSSDYDLSTMNKLPIDSLVNNKASISVEALKSGVSAFKSRPVLIPLLDLHKEHDADSLPSPTREAAPPLHVQRVFTPKVVIDTENSHRVSTPKVVLDTENCRMHPYETDAVKAVSSYQQKFSRSSFALTDRLPSPTPSEESGDGDGDTSGEVSSSSSVSNLRPVNPPPPTLGQAVPSISVTRSDGSSMPGVIPVKSSVAVSSGLSSTVRASAKSRDPRLRFVNPDANANALDQNHRALPVVNAPKTEPVGVTVNLKRQKSIDVTVTDGHLLKKQRNALENSGIVKDVKTIAGSGGWLEDSDVVGPQTMNRIQLLDNAESDPRRTDSGGKCPITGGTMSSVSISGCEQIPVTGTVAEQVPVTGTGAASIPDLLKNIAVNPTMLLNILKMGQQQRLAFDVKQNSVDTVKSTTHPPPTSNATPGTLPVVSAASSQSSGILPRSKEAVQAPPQADESGKIRMKPRDPRRVLHNNALQRNGSVDHLKTNATPSSINQETKDIKNLQKQESQVNIKASQVLAPPDISTSFTKSLKNIADIMSVSNASTSLPLAQNPASQPLQTTTSNSDQSMGVGSAPGVAAAGSRSQNAWGDVEHLFEGYNDQQKAAIQRERARRIEEQKKLFSARKLCLVLDLDHTLLNSAKFVEVDPVHDEILRKKEEQDREKPQRHLFRFPHMGMWTKLRPGIWTFLEKASKLYELHLYTMGNKLYATEMAKVLDPTGVLFNGRVISRGDDGELFDGDERVPKSKDLEGVLGMESDVVIIDDSVRVWPHNKLNLIVVERYIYFPCSRRQFGLPGPSLLEIDHDERPEDGTLACSLSVIERIHQNFFAHPSLSEADVRNILASEQRKILAGCRIVFSRVFPVGEANPHLHPLWQTAEQFGAVCTNQIDEQVTHVVANAIGTDKVNWALSTGRFVVYPGWVEASALLYRRANEQDFAIKP